LSADNSEQIEQAKLKGLYHQGMETHTFVAVAAARLASIWVTLSAKTELIRVSMLLVMLLAPCDSRPILHPT
jgi:hypothetical protein